MFKTYSFVRNLSSGSYGQVSKYIKWRNDLTIEKYAIKKINIFDYDKNIKSSIVDEITIMKYLNHPNIITYKDSYISLNKLCIVTKYYRKDLSCISYMPQISKYSFKNKCIYQILCGIDYIHSKNIVHLDIKPENIMLGADNIIKIIDFGISVNLSLQSVSKIYSNVVSRHFRPLEIYYGTKNIGKYVDMWSIGCLIYYILKNGEEYIIPYSSTMKDTCYIENIEKIFGTPNEKNWPGVTRLPEYKNSKHQKNDKIFDDIPYIYHELLNKLLILDPSKRITAHDTVLLFKDFSHFEKKIKPSLQESHIDTLKRLQKRWLHKYCFSNKHFPPQREMIWLLKKNNHSDGSFFVAIELYNKISNKILTDKKEDVQKLLYTCLYLSCCFYKKYIENSYIDINNYEKISISNMVIKVLDIINFDFNVVSSYHYLYHICHNLSSYIISTYSKYNINTNTFLLFSKLYLYHLMFYLPNKVVWSDRNKIRLAKCSILLSCELIKKINKIKSVYIKVIGERYPFVKGVFNDLTKIQTIKKEIGFIVPSSLFSYFYDILSKV